MISVFIFLDNLIFKVASFVFGFNVERIVETNEESEDRNA